MPLLFGHGWKTQHWREIGAANASDAEILGWAKENEWVVLTQDLDFSDMLFATQAILPSVVTLRVKNELDAAARKSVCACLRQFQVALEAGALLVVKPDRVRLRRLPLQA